jgi:hypothetical protein
MAQVALCNRGRSIDRVTALPCLLQPLISLRLENEVMMSKICSIIVSLLVFFTFLLFGLLPFALICTIGSKDVLTCKRLPSGRTICKRQSWLLFRLWYQATEWQLEGAQVVESYDGMGGYSYNLYLTTSKGEVNLPYYLGDREQAYQDLAQFQELLKDSFRSSFHLERGYGLFTNLLTFAMAIIMFMLFWSPPLSILSRFVLRLINSN